MPNRINRLAFSVVLVAGVLTSGCGGADSAGIGKVATRDVATITLGLTSATLAVTGHIQPTVTARASDGSMIASPTVTWNSDNPAVSVNAQGVITGISPGNAKVTATSGSASATLSIVVDNVAPGSIALNHEHATIALGQKLQLQAISFDNNGVGSFTPAAWTTSQPTVAQMNSDVVSGAGVGSATITATADGHTATSDITVVGFTSIAPVGQASGNDPCDCRPELLPDTNSLTAICGVSTSGTLYCAGKVYGPAAVPVAVDRKFSLVVGGGWTQIYPNDPMQPKNYPPWSGWPPDELVSNGFCALTSDHVAYCWAVGGSPQAVATTEQFSTVAVAGANNVGDVSACALSAVGKAFCWGSGKFGRNGNGSTALTAVPTAVATSESFVEIVANLYSTCGRTAAGAVFCWGGRRDTITTPKPLATTMTFSRLISAGPDSSCAITASSQTLMCWGSPTAVSQVAPGFQFADVAVFAGPGFSGGTCGLTLDSSFVCWGISYWGADQFGIDSHTLPFCGLYPCLKSPTATMPSEKFSHFFGASSNYCAIRLTKETVCWGPNDVGQLTDSAAKPGTRTPTIFSIAVR